MQKPLIVWANLGALIEVDRELFLTSPEEALEEAVKKGNFTPEGFSFVPGAILKEARLDPQSIGLKEFETLTVTQQEIFNGDDIEFEAYPITHRKE